MTADSIDSNCVESGGGVSLQTSGNKSSGSETDNSKLGTQSAAAERIEKSVHSRFESLRQILEENNINTTAAGLVVQTEVETFCTRADSCQCFYNRKAESAYTVRDMYLSDEPVFVIQSGNPFRLRISLEHRYHLAIPVRRVVEVYAKIKGAPDEEYISLTFHTLTTTATHHEILVLLDPRQLQTKELLRPTPWCAVTSSKYVQLEIVLVFNVDDESRVLRLYHMIYFKVIRKRAMVLCYKCLKLLRKIWEYTPQEGRGAIQGSVAVANFAVGFI